VSTYKRGLEKSTDMELRDLLYREDLSIWDRHDIEAELQKREAKTVEGDVK
jgi:hypothetical protein